MHPRVRAVDLGKLGCRAAFGEPASRGWVEH